MVCVLCVYIHVCAVSVWGVYSCVMEHTCVMCVCACGVCDVYVDTHV